MSNLLPPSATAAERALGEATARATDIPVPVGGLWDQQNCPATLLPWLAWALSVDVWDSAWSEAVKRRAIAESVAIHRRKGTVWAVREALRSVGFAEATIQEGLPRLTHDGSQLHDGVETYFGGSRWALFDVHADLGEGKGLSGADRERLSRLIDMSKPVSRHLRELSYGVSVGDEIKPQEAAATEVSPVLTEEAHFGLTYGGQIRHDGAQLIEGHDPIRHDGAWRYSSEQAYSGLSKYSRWETTGARHDNERSGLDLDAIPVSACDRYALDAPAHDGRAVFDAAGHYGADGTSPRDALAIRLTRQVRHNGRHGYDGARHHAATSVESLTA
jgi:phage tail P2-like protein